VKTLLDLLVCFKTILTSTDYEISFLRLLEKITNGATVEISYTGTSLVYRPGVIVGGQFSHECPISRSIGYFLEPLLALAPFAKHPITATLSGITNNNVDPSVDSIRTVLLPQLKKFGVGADGGGTLELKITRRGAPPLGGGLVSFSCPTVKSLKPFCQTTPGQIKKIRGIAYATRVSPQMSNRIVESARSLLTRYIPDVYIYSDVYRGLESGLSPGYSCTLVAESTTECLISAECAFQPRKGDQVEKGASTTLPDSVLQEDYTFATPEDLGIRAARLLLREIKMGGCVDSTGQWLTILFCALCPEDVSKIRVGGVTPFTVKFLRDVKTFLGVTFKIQPDMETHTVMMSCLGSGFANLQRGAK
jgi:RNA 3'-terminal phosphate cyclase-like protein